MGRRPRSRATSPRRTEASGASPSLLIGASGLSGRLRPGRSAQRLPLDSSTAKFDLSLSLTEHDAALDGTNEMRFANMDDMLRAGRFNVRRWSKEDAGIEDLAKIGLKGSPTVVSKVFGPTPRSDKADMQVVADSTPQDVVLNLLQTADVDSEELAEIRKLVARKSKEIQE